MVLGVVLTAVADELVLKQPGGSASTWTAALLCGAAAIYLLGNALFKRAVGGPWLVTHLLGVACLAVLFLLSPGLTPLTLTWICNAVLLVVVISDELGWLRRRRASADDDAVII